MVQSLARRRKRSATHAQPHIPQHKYTLILTPLTPLNVLVLVVLAMILHRAVQGGSGVASMYDYYVY